MNFEDWDDYVSVNDLVEKPKTINNNIIELKKDDNIDFIGISKENFDELFDRTSESDYFDEEIIRFRKIETFSDVELFESNKNEDLFILRKSKKLYLTYIYQSNQYYIDDNKLTFTGWDYNIIVNLDDMSHNEKNIR
jgi:hypothetical protein